MSFLLISCAHQQAPPGGPVDKTAPKIMAVIPQPNSVNVDTTTTVTITFSEAVDQRSVENAIFISPRQTESVTYKWHGKKVTIRFAEPLKHDRTYVVTIGTKAQDLRRNPMKDAFHIAFSTGNELDNGAISGRIYGENKPEGIILGAYSLTDSVPVQPSKSYPEYITQCNATGEFEFPYMAPGTYQVFAITDRNANQKYDPNRESLGIPTTFAELTPQSAMVRGLNFRMTRIDTIAPGVKGVDASDRNHLEIRFNEDIAPVPDSFLNRHFTVTVETDSLDTLKFRTIYQHSIDHSKFVAVTVDQRDSTRYVLQANDLTDISGNMLDTLRDTFAFDAVARADTSRPALEFQSIANGKKDVPVKSDLRLVFTEPMNQMSFEQNFSVSDSAKRAIDGTYKWQNPADVSFVPDQALESFMPYKASVRVDSVFDLFGNAVRDTAIEFTFSTVNVDTLSALSGNVRDALDSSAGQFYVAALKLGPDSLRYETVLDSAGPYRLEGLMPGIYFLEAFRDRDGNGKYSFGQINPFVPAERFVMIQDSIVIRSRWPNEDNDIVIPEH
ncbi:Ig-like domain-containing protein [candidate division KSB1 bacterium]|nr:Ig-like domain-containing protein [candidate division KSB1 bacterium]